jgi:hypothetical protein
MDEKGEREKRVREREREREGGGEEMRGREGEKRSWKRRTKVWGRGTRERKGKGGRVGVGEDIAVICITITSTKINTITSSLHSSLLPPSPPSLQIYTKTYISTSTYTQTCKQATITHVNTYAHLTPAHPSIPIPTHPSFPHYTFMHVACTFVHDKGRGSGHRTTHIGNTQGCRRWNVDGSTFTPGEGRRKEWEKQEERETESERKRKRS